MTHKSCAKRVAQLALLQNGKLNIRTHPEIKIGKLAVSRVEELPLLCPCAHMDPKLRLQGRQETEMAQI